MSSRRNKKRVSNFSLIFLYSIFVYSIIFSILLLTTVSAYLLTKHGYLQRNFYTNPYVGIIAIFFISLIISLCSIGSSNQVMLKPIREMIKAMKELAHGNFDIQIQLGQGIRPWELTEFCNSFNETAKELRSIEMVRSDFVNNFSHEFKTPIVSLMGFAELLKHDDLPVEKRNEYLDVIITESNRLSTLATSVLNLSRIENQAIITNLGNFNLSEQIRCAILMMESKWSKKEMELEVEVGEISFYGNAELLNQVWVNLLDNAVKFSNPGGKLEINLLELTDQVVFTVKDYGIGMDEEIQDHMFTKFYRADASQKSEGNGLGMTIVQKIVDLHFGKIMVESKKGEGTVVTITLPKQLEAKSTAVTI